MLGNHRRFVQLAVFGCLHRHVFCQRLTYTLRKGLSRTPVVAQNALYPCKTRHAAGRRLQGAFAVRRLCPGDSHSVGQALYVYRNVVLGALDFLSCLNVS